MKILQSSCITLLSMLCILPMFILSSTDETYEKERSKIINNENDQRLGSELTLNREEKQISDHLMKLKEQETGLYMSGVELNPSSILFTDAKKQIDQSKVFHFLQKMPKGGVLHVHGTAMTSVDWLVSFVTYMPNCYMCWDRQREIVFKFLFCPKLPKPTKGKCSSTPYSRVNLEGIVIAGCSWERVCYARKYYTEGAKAFDKMLINSIIFNSDKLMSVTSNQTAIWKTFEEYFSLTRNLIRYKPVFSKYIHHGLTELLKDNIQHVEIRISLSSTYQLDGNRSSSLTVAEQLVSAINSFRREECSNCTVRIIVTCHRNAPDSVISQRLEDAISISQKYPKYFAGFDLVGQEDTGKTLKTLMNILKNKNISFFFHAGETNEQGSPIDENLVDAILLGTKRIGHGYALVKHPALLKLVQKRNLPIEVCPISNQVLGFVHDLRNHPANYLIANNYPVVISSDDPAVWQASGLSHDFYLTFMGMVSMKADLRVLKQLAINSIKFSSLPAAEREIALEDWKQRWNNFITLAIYYLDESKRRGPVTEESFLDHVNQDTFRSVFRESFNK
ncbi:adenosine deaminase 2-A-like [Octopus sinensis]|uniref:adenosine deaminase n=1 Tax=Octopus sinensis TaxID=2607531 RepID=A0A7E6EZ69_9MOLL|nr:adenosine deaminase 2-A-like [Octopus sinensis]